ncbi:mediator of RNA polymerase II transcription subunit 6 [Strongylocentrotus purpuratus]|uniref:Mediator of RNA polymerase II transcription subunit 6 n=1 Tax=Strongylocentrotus purpuratus TaxID=7668 RepID=A0A7M7RFJ2_STRPU|nr:mediator of RNA polymerase II transcription subunit 6 [Strongylocentrotus purpuratus]|eukprot:XP_787850.1 PREDICTED: mediator of RNA polymerase II transcription subunit 6 [Strongylocentrotus purpuratus]
MSTDDNSLHISWHDSAWIPHLNQANIMDYFSNRSNPFYDRTCNNEIIKMQRLSPEQLKSMTGLEYILLHVQEPILYVVRKQHRHSLEESTPLADYYIVAGRVYQAPDICAVINARMTTAVHNIRSAFEESLSYSRYHPSKGYWWEFKEKDSETEKKKRKKPKEELSSAFQRKRVDILLGDLSRKFPFKVIQPKPGDRPVPVEGMSSESASARPVIKEEIKEENNQSQNNANITSTGSSSVPSMAASVTSHSNTVTGQAAAAAAAGAAAAAAAAAGLSSSTNTTSSASGTFFTNTGPSNMKPSLAKKRKIMGK